MTLHSGSHFPAPSIFLPNLWLYGVHPPSHRVLAAAGPRIYIRKAGDNRNAVGMSLDSQHFNLSVAPIFLSLLAA